MHKCDLWRTFILLADTVLQAAKAAQAANLEFDALQIKQKII
jgi:hypothetical protein